MADVLVTVVGNVGRDPELKRTKTDAPWTQLSVASTRSWRDPQTNKWVDGATTWFTVKVWGTKALNVVASVKQGTPVVVTGRLAEEPYLVTKIDDRGCENQVKQKSLLIENATIAVDLNRGTVKYEPAKRDAAPETSKPAAHHVEAPSRQPNSVPEYTEANANFDKESVSNTTVESDPLAPKLEADAVPWGISGTTADLDRYALSAA
jgi:single-strand DNA-binding protein